MGISDCYVELESTRKKSKVTVSAAPPISVESEDLGAIGDNQEVQFSQSDVQFGFSEEVNEPVTATEPTVLVEGRTGSDTQRSDGAFAFAFACAALGIAADEEVTDEPINPDPIAKIVSSVANEGDKTGAGDEVSARQTEDISSETKDSRYSAKNPRNSCHPTLTRRIGEARSESSLRGIILE